MNCFAVIPSSPCWTCSDSSGCWKENKWRGDECEVARHRWTTKPANRKPFLGLERFFRYQKKGIKKRHSFLPNTRSRSRQQIMILYIHILWYWRNHLIKNNSVLLLAPSSSNTTMGLPLRVYCHNSAILAAGVLMQHWWTVCWSGILEIHIRLWAVAKLWCQPWMKLLLPTPKKVLAPVGSENQAAAVDSQAANPELIFIQGWHSLRAISKRDSRASHNVHSDV